jgi:hypothetical protein
MKLPMLPHSRFDSRANGLSQKWTWDAENGIQHLPAGSSKEAGTDTGFPGHPGSNKAELIHANLQAAFLLSY